MIAVAFVVCILWVWQVSCEIGNLVVLDTESKNTGAACLDGSPPAFYHIPGTASGTDKWYVHYEGGGFCVSLEDCYARSLTPLGSSRGLPPTADLGGGYFSSDPKQNPLMYNWNKVLFKYCDGTFYTGDNNTITYYNGQALHFRGYRNTVAYYTRLVSSYDLMKGSDFVISGCSAGGVATFFLVDRWRSVLPQDAKVRGLPDSGFFINYEDTDSGKKVAAALRWNFVQSNGINNINEACTAAHSDDPLLCAFSAETAPYITTPIFPLQSQYDSWQLENVLGSNDSSLVNPYGLLVKTAFKNTVLAKPKNGCFLDSCYHHCGKWDDIIISNVNVGKAFQMWYEDGVGVYIQDELFPCDSCCT